MTQEQWVSAPDIPKPKVKAKDPKRISVDQAANRLMKALHGGRVSKKEKDVSIKHTPTKSMFEDMDEEGTAEDFSDLGIDIPRHGDW